MMPFDQIGCLDENICGSYQRGIRVVELNTTKIIYLHAIHISPSGDSGTSHGLKSIQRNVAMAKTHKRCYAIVVGWNHFCANVLALIFYIANEFIGPFSTENETTTDI